MKFAAIAVACWLASSATMPAFAQLTKASDRGRIVVKSTPIKTHDFWLDGRPRDTFALHFTRNDDLCRKFLGAMNEPRFKTIELPKGWDYNRISDDLFLGSRYSVAWKRFDTTGARYAHVDIDNDGRPDHVFGEAASLGSGVWFESMTWTSAPLIDPGNLSRSYGDLRRRAAPNTRRSRGEFELLLTPDAIDWGASEPADSDSDWGLGSFKSMATIDGKTFVVAGGNTRRTIGRDWFPVRLIEINGHLNHRLICELLPKYVHKDRD